MKHLIYSLFLVSILVACNSSDSFEMTVAESTEDAIVPNKVLSLQVEGMACEMACGGEIRKNIKKMAGVTRVEVNFEADRDVDKVNIYFNDTDADTEGMIELIEQLNEGQFTVHERSINDFTSDKDVSDSKSNHSSQHSINATTDSYQVPNILDLLSSLIVK